jgi:SAM-dependent methyltransferase
MNKNYYAIFFEVQKKHWWFVAKKKIVLDHIQRFLSPQFGDLEILDIGCGSGLMLNSLEKIGKTSGMDMSDDAIAFSQKIFSGTVKKGLLPNNIPYDKESFSLITALDVIEHVEDDRATLKAIWERLEYGGRAVITVPACMFLWSEHDVQNEHKRRYSLTELRIKLLEIGFKIDKISYFNTLLFPLIATARIIHNIFKSTKGGGIDLPSAPVNFILEKIFSLEKFILRFVDMPIGVSVIAVVRK